jgi:hypothetical protein
MVQFPLAATNVRQPFTDENANTASQLVSGTTTASAAQSSKVVAILDLRRERGIAGLRGGNKLKHSAIQKSSFLRAPKSSIPETSDSRARRATVLRFRAPFTPMKARVTEIRVT